MNHNTTADWNNYMRELNATALIAWNILKLGGDDKIIELDESFSLEERITVGVFFRHKNYWWIVQRVK